MTALCYCCGRSRHTTARHDTASSPVKVIHARQHDVSPRNCDVMHKAEQCAPGAASTFATPWEIWRRQLDAQHWISRASANVQRVFVLSFLVRGMTKTNFKYVILKHYGWNFVGAISIYKASFLQLSQLRNLIPQIFISRCWALFYSKPIYS